MNHHLTEIRFKDFDIDPDLAKGIEEAGFEFCTPIQAQSIPIALTGKDNSELESLSDVCICTPGGQFADRIQELHIKVLHILIEMVERKFHPENYQNQA